MHIFLKENSRLQSRHFREFRSSAYWHREQLPLQWALCFVNFADMLKKKHCTLKNVTNGKKHNKACLKC